jgi:SAM-dependent methyltransferase
MTTPHGAAPTNETWEQVARDNPYWGVLSHDTFDRAGGDDERLTEFWASGDSHVRHVLHHLRAHVDPGFAPATAVDFGCGVGRLLIPLAGECRHIHGVDISETMRTLARGHLAERGIGNVTVVASLDELADLRGTVDLVHSVLVLQHIRPKTGIALFEQLVGLLAPGGCGAVQFCLGRLQPAWREALGVARQRYRAVNVLANLARGRLTTEGLPYEMNPYDLKHPYAVLGRAGITELWSENHQDLDGMYATLYFRRPA